MLKVYITIGGPMAVGVPKFEGVARVAGDMGTPILAVRNDAATVFANVADGDYAILQVDDTGALRVTGAGSSGGDGTIIDGVSAAIKATVLDYSNSNPLAVRLTDTTGDYVAAGAGTQYTEDAAAAANPVGSMVMLRRKDTLSASEVSADGDNIAGNATSKGELYVKHIDAIPITDNGGSLTVDGSVTADTELPSAAALADATANPTTPLIGAGALLFNGTTWDRVRGDTTNGLDVDVTRVPAAARTTDSIGVAHQTDAIMSNLTALTPKFVIISGATSGDNTVLAAVTSKKIRVLSMHFISAGATTVRFESGAGGTALTGVMSFVANTGMVLPFNPLGWFETASNTLLNMELNAAVQVSGSLVYVEV